MYGLLISLGILFSVLIAEYIAKKEHYNLEHLWGISLWTILGGITGARLYHVIDYWELYSQNPRLILYIWNGGLGIFGALIGGIIGLFVYLSVKKEAVKPWINLAAIVVPLGQSIGRWGNFFNQELFGKPTTLLWGLYIPVENRPQVYISSDTFHPLFIYESLLNFILFAFLYSLYKRKVYSLDSSIFLWTYLLGYSVIRFSLEFLKIDPWRIGNINVAQGICTVLILVAIPNIISVVKSKKSSKLGGKA